MAKNPSLLDHPRKSLLRKPRSSRRIHQDILLDEDTYATTLLVLFLDRYTNEALEWHPETIRMQIEADIGIELPKHSLDKLMAAIVVVTTNYFYRNLIRFIELANILAGDDFDPTVFDPADSAEMAWAVTEVLLLSPPEKNEWFDEEIRDYVSEMLMAEGFIKLPKVLKTVASEGFEEKVDLGGFEDDPEMFQAIYQGQEAKSTEIDALVQENMNELIAQLEALPLRNGQTDNMVRRLKEGLK